jgi:hypothetical protein
MEQHGYVSWDDIDQKLARDASCPKLKSYWHFHDCGYTKLRRTCAKPDHISGCPVPTHDLRNGRLNQTAYALYLFVRDLADGDLIGWIDQRPQAANSLAGPDGLALSSLLLGAPAKLRLWPEVGAARQAAAVARGRRHHGRQWCTTFCTAPGFCTGLRPTMPMARPATGQAAALRSLQLWPHGSTPAPSTRPSRRRFRGSCSNHDKERGPKYLFPSPLEDAPKDKNASDRAEQADNHIQHGYDETADQLAARSSSGDQIL